MQEGPCLLYPWCLGCTAVGFLFTQCLPFLTDDFHPDLPLNTIMEDTIVPVLIPFGFGSESTEIPRVILWFYFILLLPLLTVDILFTTDKTLAWTLNSYEC